MEANNRNSRERAYHIFLISLCCACLCVFMRSGFVTLAVARDLRIGVFAPMTGPAAESGIVMKNASILAMEEINRTGGILGRKIELFFGDDESKTAAGVSVVERLINKDKVDIVVGGMNSNVGLAVMEIVPKYDIPLILTCPAAYKITEKIVEDPKKYRYVIKSNPSTYAYGIGYKDFVGYLERNKIVNFKNKTMVILGEQTDWGKSLAEAQIAELGKLGWKALANDVHDIGETNYISMLSKMKTFDAEILITNETSASAAASLARQFVEQGLRMLFLQSYGPFKPGYLEAVGNRAEGVVAIVLNEVQGEVGGKFRDSYTKRWGSADFDVCGGVQYDMLYLIKEAYEKAGSFENQRFINEFLGIKKKGTVGTFAFDVKSHEAAAGEQFVPQAVKQVQGGKLKWIWPENVQEAKFLKPHWLK